MVFIANYVQLGYQFRPNRWEWATKWYNHFTEEDSETEAALPGFNLYYKYEKEDSNYLLSSRY